MEEVGERENGSFGCVQLAHGYAWGDEEERLERNERRVNEDLRCRYEGCERLCRSRAGLVRHESMLHWRVEGRVRFACEDCGLEVATKGSLIGHCRTCGAGTRLEDGRRECGGCGSPEYPTRTSPVTCGLAGLGGQRRRRMTGEVLEGEWKALDGWEGTSVGAWIGGLVASIVGGW